MGARLSRVRGRLMVYLVAALPLLGSGWFLLRPAAGQTGTTNGRLVVPPEVMSSNCLTAVSPTYPQTKRLPGNTTVRVQVMIDRAGQVHPLQILSGPPPFQDAAKSALRLWRYRPYASGGTPVDVVTELNVVFIPGRQGGMISHPGH